MSRHVFVRPVRKEDTEKFIEWSKSTKNNLFDPMAGLYPTSFTICAYNENGPITYVPVQHPYFLEHLAINPNADKIDIAVSLKELTQFVVSQAHIKGVGEIYFLCKEKSTADFAKAQCFEEMPYRMFRLKISDLEKHDTNNPKDS